MAVVASSRNALFSLSFEDNLDEFRGKVEKASTWAVPYAASTALSRTAYDASKAEQAALNASFDRPVALTQRAVLYRKATADNLTYLVFLRDEMSSGGTAPQRYLEAEILSGARRAKPFEVRLRSAGVLSSGQYALPARGYPLDRFGNIPSSVISKIISQLGGRRDVGVMQNTTSRSRKRSKARGDAQYFVPDPSSALPRGVYERMSGRRIRAVLIFVMGAPGYKRRYAFGEAALATASKVFGGHFAEAFNKLTLGK